MKKILIPTLITAVIPTTCLTGCGSNQNTPIEQPTFTIESAQMDSASTATIVLDWSPSDHILEFSTIDFTFTKDGKQEKTSTKCDDLTARPLTINVNFLNEVTNDIEDGKLTINYFNKTTKTDQLFEKNNIHISKYTPMEWTSIDVNNYKIPLIKSNIKNFEANTKYKFNFDFAKFPDEFWSGSMLNGKFLFYFVNELDMVAKPNVNIEKIAIIGGQQEIIVNKVNDESELFPGYNYLLINNDDGWGIMTKSIYLKDTPFYIFLSFGQKLESNYAVMKFFYE